MNQYFSGYINCDSILKNRLNDEELFIYKENDDYQKKERWSYRLSNVIHFNDDDYKKIYDDLKKERFKITVYRKHKDLLNMTKMNFYKLINNGYFEKEYFDIDELIN